MISSANLIDGITKEIFSTMSYTLRGAHLFCFVRSPLGCCLASSNTFINTPQTADRSTESARSSHGKRQ